jgi:transcriptional regulator with XRE-family HTH domain
MRIGRTIRELRLAAGATLEELAHKAGLDASNLSRIERDLQEPSAGCAWRIADALHVSLGDLFEEAARARQQGGAEPIPRGSDRQADSLLKVFYRLNENNRGLAVQMLRLLEKTQD